MKAILPLSIFVALFASVSASISGAQELRSGYRLDESRCDGYPQISVTTPQGLCVGLVAAKDNGLKMPRYAAQAPDGTIYISDMGGWAFGSGTIWAYRADKNKQTQWVNLFPQKKLTTPNGLLVDPEGRLYIGTPTGIVRFLPRDARTGEFKTDAELEVVADQFAQSIFRKDEYKGAREYNALNKDYKNKHPLIQMTANKDFTQVYFNVGAPSNDCSRGIKTLNEEGLCIQSESALASAAVWRIDLAAGADRKVIRVQPFARGLRNSMALAVHPETQKVFQGENGIDLTDPEKPYEEINLLEAGQHYGWPYCHSAGEVSPFFVGRVNPEVCRSKYKAPVMFLPAHSAPLGMFFYQGQKLPELKGKLLVGLHGYAKYGHRVVAINANAQGLVGDNKVSEVVAGWEALPGVRPLGAPTGLLELQDGSVLIMDDKNGAVLRLSSGQNKTEDLTKVSEQPTFSEKTLLIFSKVLPALQKNCALCHTEFAAGGSEAVLQKLHKNGMINLKNPMESGIYRRVHKREMPPDFVRGQLGFKDQDAVQLEALIESFLRGL